MDDAPGSVPPPPTSILVIPGLDGHPGLLQGVGGVLFPGLAPLYFNHQLDRAADGVEGLADRALALAEAHLGSASRFFLAGESFGGTVALTLARRLSTRVRGLILLSAFGVYPGRQMAATGIRAAALLGDRSAQTLLRVAHHAGTFSQLGLRHSREARRAYRAHPAPDVQAYRAKCALSVTFDARPWLHEIRCPTLVLTGSLDVVVPVSAGRELAARIPGAALHALSGGHIPHVARAAEAGAVIQAWLARLPA